MQPQDPLSNNQPTPPTPSANPGGSPTFQIPRPDANAAPAPAPVTPQIAKPPVYDPARNSGANLPPQPEMHKPPIFMQDDSDIPMPFTKSGTASSEPVDPFAPKQQATRPPVQSQIPRPAPVQQPILPTNLPPARPRRQSSMVKYIVAGLVILVFAGLLVWAVGSITSNNEPEKEVVEKPQYKEFISEELGFATAYPEAWTHEQGRRNGLDLVRFSHPKIRDNNTATAEVGIIRLTTQQLKNIKDKDQFFETYTKTIADGFNSYSETDASELTIDGLPAKKVVADIVQNGENDKAIFYLVYAEEDGFIIITSADKTEYDNLKTSMAVFVDRFESKLASTDTAAEEESAE